MYGSKTKILIIYSYFYPGYKAGGPVQSIYNLIATLGKQFDFFVLTSAFDLNERSPYEDIQVDKWVECEINQNTIPVYYCSKKPTKAFYGSILKDLCPAVVYINGIYSIIYNIYPLLASRKRKLEIIVCPRGMLQAGALAVKPLKKKIYLNILLLTGILKDVTWHATTEDEKKDIQNYIGNRANIIVSGNIPKQPLLNLPLPNKEVGLLKLVFLSLITEKKNLSLLISVCKGCKTKVYLDIFGPIKDVTYWEDCKKLLVDLASNLTINYKGDLPPNLVQDKLLGYDAFILLTKGENFGHAIFESFSVGRPVITSHFTPWNGLEADNAGWNVDIGDINSISLLLDRLSMFDNEKWLDFCKGAHHLAIEHIRNNRFEESYSELFRPKG